MVKGVVAFDMDGVLVEVSESYRETIVQTVKHFGGQTISRDLIQEYKNAGGWNNDWSLSQQILRDQGTEVAYDAVVERFNRIFFGEGETPGLILREQWFPRPGLLDRLAASFHLAIFTGRMREEADITLQRFAAHLQFDPLISADRVTLQKPHPEGLLALQAAHPGQPVWYLGDTVDDARSARAAAIPFIGVVAKSHTRRAEVIRLFEQEQALAIIDEVNELERVLP